MNPKPWIPLPESWSQLPNGLLVVAGSLFLACVICFAPSGPAFYLAAKGRAPRVAYGIHYAIIALGAGLFALGLAARHEGQPAAIWINLMLVGGICALEMTLHLPLLALIYRRTASRPATLNSFKPKDGLR